MRTTFKSLACPFAFALMSSGFVPSAMADHDHGRGHGHGHGHGHKHHAQEHKEEFWDGNCKIERKWEKDGDFKEKRTCKDVVVRPAQPVAIQPVTVIYPPWVVVEQGRPQRYRSGYEPAPVPQVPVQQAQVSYCNSETVGKVLGGVAGALLGNQVGKGSGRAVATVGGAIAGVLVGGEVGRQMDARDQACIGQALELAPAGRRVEWVDGGGKYAVVPGAVVTRGDTYCRPYQAQVHTPAGWQTTRGTACRRKDGVWVTTA